MSRIVRRSLLLFLCSVGLAFAADEAAPAPAGDNAASLPEEPDVTIIHRGKERVEEFSINNQIYMIKITPAKGYPYYLIDTTGDGSFDTRRAGLKQNVVVPQWVLFRWK